MEAYCRIFEKYRKFEEAEKKIILILLPRNNHFLGNLLLYILYFFLFFSFPVLPTRICVLKILKMCRRGPDQENFMAFWETQCFTEVLKRRKERFC